MDRLRTFTLWAVALIALLLAFDYAMSKDAAHLCASDATAYPECSQ